MGTPETANTSTEPIDKSTAPLSIWKRCKRCTLALVIIIAASVAGVLYANSDLFSKEHYRQFIENNLSEMTGLRILLGDIGIAPGRNALVLKQVVVFAEDKPALTIEKARASVSFRKLLTGSFELDGLLLEKPNIIISRKTDGSFNISFLNDADPDKPIGNKIWPFTFFRKIEIVDGALSFLDMAIGEDQFSVKISKFNLKISRGFKPGILSVDLSGQIDDQKIPTKFEVNGDTVAEYQSDKVEFEGVVKADKLDMAKFWPYIRPYAPFEKANAVLSLNTKIKTDFHNSISSIGKIICSQVDIRYEQAFRSPLKQRDMVITHNVEGLGDRLIIKEASVVADDIAIRSQGKIIGLKNDNPVFSLAFETNRFDFSSLLRFVPDSFLTPQQASFLTNNIKRGQVRLDRFKFDGDLEQLLDPKDPDSYKAFSGLLSISDVELSFEDLYYNFNQVNGALELVDGRLHISDAKGKYGESQVSTLSGVVTRLHDWPLFDFAIKGSLHLDKTLQSLSTTLASADIKAILGKIDSATGSVTLDIGISGDTKHIAETLKMEGEMVLNQVGVESHDFGLPIYDLDGVIRLSIQNFHFDKLSWKAGSSTFELSGDARDVFTPKPEFELNLASQLNLGDLRQIEFLDIENIGGYSGMALLYMQMAGSFAEFNIVSQVDMTEAQFHLGDLVNKPLGFKNKYILEGVVRDGVNAKINNMTVQTGESVVEISGSVAQLLKEQSINLAVRTSGAKFNDLDVVFNGLQDIEGEGAMAGELNIVMEADGEPVKLNGNVKLENAGFKIGLFDKPFRNVYATVDMNEGVVEISGGRASIGDSPFIIDGKILLKEKNEFTLNAKAQTLNLNDLFGEEDDDEQDEIIEEEIKDDPDEGHSFFDGTWDINIKSDKGRIGPIHYQDLTTKMIYDEKQLQIKPIRFKAHGGQWEWKSLVKFAPSSFGFDSDIKIKDVDMEDYLAISKNVTDVITGKISVDGTMASSGQKWTDMKKNLDGELNVKTGKGVIHRFAVLSKVFSLLNLSQYFKNRLPDMDAEGLPFDSISGNFIVKSGVAHVDNLNISSEAMRITAVGDYDIASNAVDMRAGVMPLIAIDRVLSAIPLVGHVLTGDNKSFITSYYVIKGPLENAKVTSVPVESIAVNILGIFERIITLPVKALETMKYNGEKPTDQEPGNLEKR